jgi:hypothetical protein
MENSGVVIQRRRLGLIRAAGYVDATPRLWVLFSSPSAVSGDMTCEVSIAGRVKGRMLFWPTKATNEGEVECIGVVDLTTRLFGSSRLVITGELNGVDAIFHSDGVVGIVTDLEFVHTVRSRIELIATRNGAVAAALFWRSRTLSSEITGGVGLGVAGAVDVCYVCEREAALFVEGWYLAPGRRLAALRVHNTTGWRRDVRENVVFCDRSDIRKSLGKWLAQGSLDGPGFCLLAMAPRGAMKGPLRLELQFADGDSRTLDIAPVTGSELLIEAALRFVCSRNNAIARGQLANWRNLIIRIARQSVQSRARGGARRHHIAYRKKGGGSERRLILLSRGDSGAWLCGLEGIIDSEQRAPWSIQVVSIVDEAEERDLLLERWNEYSLFGRSVEVVELPEYAVGSWLWHELEGQAEGTWTVIVRPDVAAFLSRLPELVRDGENAGQVRLIQDCVAFCNERITQPQATETTSFPPPSIAPAWAAQGIRQAPEPVGALAVKLDASSRRLLRSGPGQLTVSAVIAGLSELLAARIPNLPFERRRSGTFLKPGFERTELSGRWSYALHLLDEASADPNASGPDRIGRRWGREEIRGRRSPAITTNARLGGMD